MAAVLLKEPSYWEVHDLEVTNTNGKDEDQGELFGIYVDVASYPSTGIDYTNGGPTVFSNTELSLTTYYGQGDPPFTTFFAYRQWNGTVHYDIVPVELQSFSIE